MATSASTPEATPPPQATFGSTVRGLVPSIIIGGVLPYFVYQYLKGNTGVSDLVALAISAIPAIIWGLYGVIQQRRLDLIAAVTLVGIAVTIVAALLGGDPRLFLIREEAVTLTLGIACLVSMLFPKPLWFYIIRYFASGNDPARASAFSANWQYAGFRHAMRVVTLVWGVTWVGEFLLRIILVYNMSIPQFLAISPFIFYAVTIAVIGFTFIYSDRSRKQGAARQAAHEAAATQQIAPR